MTEQRSASEAQDDSRALPGDALRLLPGDAREGREVGTGPAGCGGAVHAWPAQGMQHKGACKALFLFIAAAEGA